MKKLLLTALLSLSSFGAFAEVKTVVIRINTPIFNNILFILNQLFGYL